MASNVSGYISKLSCVADSPHHAQGVVAEGDVGVERSAYDPPLYVAEAVEQVHQFAEAVGCHAQGHGVYGKVAAADIVLEGAVFDNWIARVAAV